MDLVSNFNYSTSALSLVVPILTIAMVILTRKVALSLLVGILAGGIMLFYDKPLSILLYVYSKISSVFYSYSGENGLEIAFGSVYVFGFLILLGILTQIIYRSGAINSFINWAHKRVKTPQGSEFIAFLAGIVIFVDDYFNALTVGQISKQLNDANKSSRERLAYIIDSTSAPICILVPISSWGAYIIGVMDTNVPKDFGDGLFLLTSTISSNFYAWFALFGVFLTIYWQVNLKAMQKNINVDVKDHLSSSANSEKTSSVWLLIIPILTLFVSIFIFIFLSGYLESKSTDIITMLSNSQTAFSLFYGGLLTIIISVMISFKHLHTSDTWPIIKEGFLSMLPAIVILVLAWSIGPVIRDDMATGSYLASVAQDVLKGDSISYIPVILFVISAFIGFSTGTSWGTFAIMIPIGVGIVGVSGGDIAIVLSAILGGAVFGDHCSPISDTTILSATGAGCSVQSHFITQLPYVVSIFVISLCSYILVGFSSSVIAGYILGVALMIGVFYAYKKFISKPIYT